MSMRIWQVLYATSALALAFSLFGYFAWKALSYPAAGFFLGGAGISGALCALCAQRVKRYDHFEAVHLAKGEQMAHQEQSVEHEGDDH